MSYAISVKIFFLKLIGSYAEAFLYNKVCLNVVRPSYSRSYGSLRLPNKVWRLIVFAPFYNIIINTIVIYFLLVKLFGNY